MTRGLMAQPLAVPPEENRVGPMVAVISAQGAGEAVTQAGGSPSTWPKSCPAPAPAYSTLPRTSIRLTVYCGASGTSHVAQS